MSLNEGAHQLRLYPQGPDGTEPMTAACLRESGQHPLPCASLLVRLVKAPRGPNEKALEVCILYTHMIKLTYKTSPFKYV